MGDELNPEIERLRSFLEAIAQHGWTVWPNSSCGGGVGGQAITTTDHGEVVTHLTSHALRGSTLTEAADEWDRMYPGCSRLDEPAKPARRRGPDGRPR